MGPKDNTIHEGNFTQEYVRVAAASFITSFLKPEVLRSVLCLLSFIRKLYEVKKSTHLLCRLAGLGRTNAKV